METIETMNYNNLKIKKDDIIKQMIKLKEDLKMIEEVFIQKARKEKANEYSKKLMKDKYKNDIEFKERRKQKALEYYYEKKKRLEAEVPQ